MYECKKCNVVFKTKNNLINHRDTKTCNIKVISNKRNKFMLEKCITLNDEYSCKKCNKIFKKFHAFSCHYQTLHINIERNGFQPSGFVSDSFHKFQQSEEYKLEQSLRMKEVVKVNPESYSSSNVSGRVKTSSRNYFGIDMKFKGTWELLVAEKLFESNIKFTNIIEPIEYFWEESGKNHLYFPDFYIEKYDLFIEVKGYERPRDLDKWKSLSNLVILKEKEISELKSGIDIKRFLDT